MSFCTSSWYCDNSLYEFRLEVNLKSFSVNCLEMFLGTNCRSKLLSFFK